MRDVPRRRAGDGATQIGSRLAAELVALGDPYTVRDAMDYLRASFGREDARGPRALEAFVEAGDDRPLRADCVGFAPELLAAWDRLRRK
jgi:hypothetical protein